MTKSPGLSRRRVVVERAAWCCEYCRSQARFCPDPFVVEHVVPRSGGGLDDLSNLAFACQSCNGHLSLLDCSASRTTAIVFLAYSSFLEFFKPAA